MYSFEQVSSSGCKTACIWIGFDEWIDIHPNQDIHSPSTNSTIDPCMYVCMFFCAFVLFSPFAFIFFHFFHFFIFFIVNSRVAPQINDC